MPKTTDKSRSRSAPVLARAETETSGDGQPAGKGPLSPELLRKMDAYWRASNYLSVGQIYLLANPLDPFPAQPRCKSAFRPARNLFNVRLAENMVFR